MNTKQIFLKKGWVAFVNNSVCVGIIEIKEAGSYSGQASVINKPTKEEVVAELTKLKITLPK